MIKPLVTPLSKPILPFSFSFSSIRMKLLDILQLTGLCPLTCTGSLYQHFQHLFKVFLLHSSGQYVETYFLYLYLSFFFLLHAFFQASVTILLLPYPFSIGITSISPEIVSGSVCGFMVYLDSDAGVRKQKEQGMEKSRGEESS